MEFINEVAIVTGAGRGIGRAIALNLAQGGANLVIIDVLDTERNSVVREVEDMGRQALGIKCDIRNKNEVEQAAQATIEKFQKVDLLVNCAGISNVTPTLELSEEDWDRVIDTNLKGALLCCQAFGRYMIQGGKGRIVNISSTSGHRGGPQRAAYCSSKAGIIGLTKALAVEWAQHGVTVNSVSPGWTKTPMQDRLMETQPGYKERESRIPTKRRGEPEEIAYAVAFLASAKALQITGQDIVVDGGVLAINPMFA